MREYLKWLTVALALTAIISTDGCKKKEQINPPTVNVFEGAITIQFTSASVAAEVTDQGGADVKSRGFIYGLSGGSLDTVFCGSGVGVYSAELNNLQPNTTYVYEAFAKNAGGTGTSGKVSFTTKPLPTYTISVSANPSDGGVVNGGGSFQEGQYCSVTATANEGYTFTNWTENDNEVSTDAYYTFMVNGNRTLKANFTAQLPNEYTISLSANPNNGGSVSGGGIYQEGQFCTVSAIANDGYAFANWTENGEVVSSDANYSFTVNGNRTLVANFDVLPPNSYSINVTADPSDGGIVSGGGTYQQGQSCTVTATNIDNYSFTNWTENENVVSTSANYTFTVNGNRTLVAHFTTIGTSNYTINVSADPSNGGIVSGGGTYQQGHSCTVQATANNGYIFANWTENDNEVSTNANYTFTVNSNRNLVAHFTIQGANTYTINVSANPSNGGTVAGGGTYEEGLSCEVRATANSGYTFVNWTENDTQVSANANYTFTVNGNRNLVANFTQQNTYTISAGVTPTGAGSVTGDGTYQQGQICTLRATPATGFTFQKWTKNGTQVSTNATYEFTVTESATFVAHFQLETYTIYASASPYSGGTVTGSGQYNYGENCTLGATAATGYTFVNWTKNGTQVSLNPTYTFPVTASGSYVAHFDMQPYNINLSANPSNGGTVSGGGVHYYQQSCTVHAVANSGYTFINWTENGGVVSTNANYQFTVSGNRSLVAHFINNPQAPTGAINGLFSVSATQQVWFSQGNLQYKASTNTWRFATNQWDYVGEANSNISSSYSGWIDLFGWGTSGWSNGNVYYQPYDQQNNGNSSQGYGYGPTNGTSYEYGLTGSYANADWGMYNQISGSSGSVGLWRTLRKNEWEYIFNTRSASTVNGTMNARYAGATVNNVAGVVLFPDNYTHPSIAATPTGINYCNFSLNNWSGTAWTAMQEAGCVFLPAAGCRIGTSVIYDYIGYYWSSSNYNPSNAYYARFPSNVFYYYESYHCHRYYGLSVRLVFPAN